MSKNAAVRRSVTGKLLMRVNERLTIFNSGSCERFHPSLETADIGPHQVRRVAFGRTEALKLVDPDDGGGFL
jgi:hypothetical protein